MERRTTLRKAALHTRSDTATRRQPAQTIFSRKFCAAWLKTTSRSWERISIIKPAGGSSEGDCFVKQFPVVRSGLIWWRVLALAWFCGFFFAVPARALWQQPRASQSSESQSTGGSSQPPPSGQDHSSSPASKAPTTLEKAAGRQKPRAKKAPAISGKSRTVSTKKRKSRTLSPRVRRMRQAFVASTTLRPMTQQRIQDRSPAAYAGVEAYARAHPKEDAGALAWLGAGYAHLLHREF